MLKAGLQNLIEPWWQFGDLHIQYGSLKADRIMEMAVWSAHIPVRVPQAQTMLHLINNQISAKVYKTYKEIVHLFRI